MHLAGGEILERKSDVIYKRTPSSSVGVIFCNITKIVGAHSKKDLVFNHLSTQDFL